MLLIHAETKRLEVFNDERRLPPYAILSHTWGDSEVTLQQFRSLQDENNDANSDTRGLHTISTALGSIKETWGYQKIEAACRQALEDGIAHVWCDTCCIDKTSSAELSEAINSMFRWYKKAAICYAYLDDIEAPTSEHGHGLISREELAKAKWFTRGWTLQELIAPRNMNFYAKGWRLLGTKITLLEKLEEITGIDRPALKYGILDSFSIAKRMSWAAHRQTTKIEDVAYCLLGIFDVCIPLLYGEGDKAFGRLQEEIMKDSDDQSMFAWYSTDVVRPKSHSAFLDDNSSDDGEYVDDAWGGTSMFASHPRLFANTSKICPILPACGIPYALTNRGIRIELPVLPYTGGLPKNVVSHFYSLMVIMLECYYGDGTEDRPGIVVQSEVKCHDNGFVRHHITGLVRIPYGTRIEPEDRKIILLRKKSTFVL